MPKLETLPQDEWWECGKKFTLSCCDCGLSHVITIKKKLGRPYAIMVQRDRHTTGGIRRHLKGKCP